MHTVCKVAARFFGLENLATKSNFREILKINVAPSQRLLQYIVNLNNGPWQNPYLALATAVKGWKLEKNATYQM